MSKKDYQRKEYCVQIKEAGFTKSGKCILNLRCKLTRNKKTQEIEKFTAQLEEYNEDAKKYEVISRYDNAHEVIHKDEYRKNGKGQIKTNLKEQFNSCEEAYKFAIKHYKHNWKKEQNKYHGYGKKKNK